MFRRLFLAWRIARDLPSRPFNGEWTETDRDWLRGALGTVRGIKFRRLLDSQVAEVAIWAVNRNDSVRACGYAAGVAFIAGWIDSLSEREPEETEQDEYDIENSMLDQ